MDAKEAIDALKEKVDPGRLAREKAQKEAALRREIAKKKELESRERSKFLLEKEQADERARRELKNEIERKKQTEMLFQSMFSFGGIIIYLLFFSLIVLVIGLDSWLVDTLDFLAFFNQ